MAHTPVIPALRLRGLPQSLGYNVGPYLTKPKNRKSEDGWRHGHALLEIVLTCSVWMHRTCGKESSCGCGPQMDKLVQGPVCTLQTKGNPITGKHGYLPLP